MAGLQQGIAKTRRFEKAGDGHHGDQDVVRRDKVTLCSRDACHYVAKGGAKRRRE
jgi:hypothetical protein